MSLEFIPFPVSAKRFFLRSDFADELCFRDYCTSRAIQKQVRTQLYCGGTLQEPVLDAYDPDLCDVYRRARFFLYCGIGVKDLGAVLAHVTDGREWMPTKNEGLYKDMIERAGRAYGAPDKLIVFPPANCDGKKWRYPAHAVLHDTAFSSAAILPYETALNYLHQYNK